MNGPTVPPPRRPFLGLTFIPTATVVLLAGGAAIWGMFPSTGSPPLAEAERKLPEGGLNSSASERIFSEAPEQSTFINRSLGVVVEGGSAKQGSFVTWSMPTDGDEARGGRSSAPLDVMGSLEPSRHLLAVHLERATDGLPITAMYCSKDGRCGECQTDSDCPAGKGCVANRDSRRFECLESECESDMDCAGALVCRSATSGISGPVIKRCTPAGVRRQGETCDTLFVSQSGACQHGLVCHRGVCSAPCEPEGAAPCPDGFACEEGLHGAACFPDCRAQGCASGQVCKRLNDTDYQCLESTQGQCPEVACAQGERCNIRLSRGHAVFWCAARCDPFRADSCPTGQVCGVGGPTESTCFRQCDPGQPDACGAGFQCASITEDMTSFGCTPVISSGSTEIVPAVKP